METTIKTNTNRVGNFTSSNIAELMTYSRDGQGLGKPAQAYIAEKRMERRLQRSLTDESSARPIAWGNLLEQYAFDQLGMEYTLASQTTLRHQAIEYWTGSPDGWKDDVVMDIKCPMTLKSFCQLVDPIYNGLEGMAAMNAIRETHKDGDKYFWQLVSNAILTGSTKAELIIFCPYQSELEIIRDLATNYNGDREFRYFWIANATDDELPYLNDGGYYENVNVISFDVSDEDKQALTDRVVECGKMLI
tara:strand:+ start:3824 stop:4567 length:744 start_codon:yes stop_codon:yes gene_type:complete